MAGFWILGLKHVIDDIASNTIPNSWIRTKQLFIYIATCRLRSIFRQMTYTLPYSVVVLWCSGSLCVTGTSRATCPSRADCQLANWFQTVCLSSQRFYHSHRQLCAINSLVPRIFGYCLNLVNFKLMSTIDCYQVNATTPYWSLVNIGSGNGLVPSGNKPLPESILT